MALFVKLVQNNDPLTPRAFGMWFGRAVHMETITLKELATTMQDNCTVKRSDILAVLAELVDTMKYEMQRGRKVSIEGLGTFKLGVHSRGVTLPQEFRPERDIIDTHVLFLPEKYQADDGRRLDTLAKGTEVKRLSEKKGCKPFRDS